MKTLEASVRARHLAQLIEWNNLSKLSTIAELRMTMEPQRRRFDSTDIILPGINHSRFLQANNALTFRALGLLIERRK